MIKNTPLLKLSKLLLLLIAASLLISCSHIKSKPKYVTPSYKYHIVKKGDTLNAISHKSGISVKNLKLFNNLENDIIYPGQKIHYRPRIKGRFFYRTGRNVPANGIHIVSKGENLAHIANLYDLDLLKLITINQIDYWELEPGSKIYLKSAPAPPESVTEKKKSPPAAVTQHKPQKVSKTKPVNRDEGKADDKVPHKLDHLPLEQFVISQHYNRKTRHNGIDLAAPKGTPVHAVLDGRVVYAGIMSGYGNVVLLEHDNRLITVYAHNEMNVADTGDYVKAGDKIATVGSTGRSTGNHLHFEIRKKGIPFDPRRYFANS